MYTVIDNIFLLKCACIYIHCSTLQTSMHDLITQSTHIPLKLHIHVNVHYMHRYTVYNMSVYMCLQDE